MFSGIILSVIWKSRIRHIVAKKVNDVVIEFFLVFYNVGNVALVGGVLANASVSPQMATTSTPGNFLSMLKTRPKLRECEFSAPMIPMRTALPVPVS